MVRTEQPRLAAQEPHTDTGVKLEASPTRYTYRGRWHIYYDPPPIPIRSCDWHFHHDDFDGAEDSRDDRYGHGISAADCELQIDDWEADQ